MTAPVVDGGQTRRVSHRRGAAVTDSIRAAALLLAARTGSLDLSVEAIAAEAGVNKTTVYRRWDTAEALLADAVGDHAGRAVPLEATGDLETDLRRLADLVLANIASPIGRALLTARHTGGEAITELRSHFWDQRLELAAGLVEPHRVAGAPDATTLVEALVAPLHFRAVERGGSFTDRELDELVHAVARRVRAGD